MRKKGSKKEKSVAKEDKEKGERRNVLLVKSGLMQQSRGWEAVVAMPPVHPQMTVPPVAVLGA